VDGAAFNVAKGTWHRIADAPLGIQDYAGHAMVGDVLYIQTRSDLLAYDVSDDQWKRIESPGGGALSADGSRLVFASDSDENGTHPDRVYDTTTGRWSKLPDDPIGPAFDRVITSTPAGLVLTAKKLVGNPVRRSRHSCWPPS
jgi:hypothetical protein